MRRRSRLLRVAKWGGVVAFVLLIAAGVANLRYTVAWKLPDGSGLGTGSGQVCMWRGWYGQSVGLTIVDSEVWQFWPMEFRFGGPRGVLAAPIWVLLLTIGIPTIVLWRLDRGRALPGHCPCGYDLTGNVSGTCPECGREASGCG